MNLTGIKDIDFKILNELDDKSLVKYCTTNKEANKVCNNQIFWMNRTIKIFPYVYVEILRKNKGNKEWSEYYIDDLRKINTRNANRYLLKGSKEGRMDFVLISLNKEANIHIDDVRLASKNGHLEVVKYLVSLGANIRSENDFALKYASRNGHLEVVKYLVSLGANIHADYDYAVKYASQNGHLDVVKYLVSLGAPPTI